MKNKRTLLVSSLKEALKTILIEPVLQLTQNINRL